MKDSFQEGDAGITPEEGVLALLFNRKLSRIQGKNLIDCLEQAKAVIGGFWVFSAHDVLSNLVATSVLARTYLIKPRFVGPEEMLIFEVSDFVLGREGEYLFDMCSNDLKAQIKRISKWIQDIEPKGQ
jgi:hypothetical protein